jgi:hypothetical protein
MGTKELMMCRFPVYFREDQGKWAWRAWRGNQRVKQWHTTQSNTSWRGDLLHDLRRHLFARHGVDQILRCHDRHDRAAFNSGAANVRQNHCFCK